MTRSSRRTRNTIRGPRSALTDFLASTNASDALANASARRTAAQEAAAAAAAEAAENANNESATATNEDGQEDEEEDNTTPASGRRRAQQLKRKKEAEAIEKIKKSKAFQKRKRQGDDSDSDDLAAEIFKQKSTPLPGQMENCAICDKRFTVTPYSRAGPDGGLLCSKCGKDLAKDTPTPNKKKRAAGQGAGRRKMQSRILDGTYTSGAKPLLSLCIELLAKNIDLADDLGALPPIVVDKIARHVSKRRLLNSQTLNLFLEPQHDEVKIYDGAHLSSDDYVNVFQRVPNLKNLKIRNGIQFKDEVMEYLVTRNINLEGFSLHGANLLSEDTWLAYLKVKGQHLKSLQIYYTDKHVGDDLLKSLEKLCPNLERLKISNNQKVTDKGVEHIAKLKSLQHLSLDLRTETTTEPYVKVIKSIGSTLRTLSLKRVPDLDDRVLDAIHEHCRSLDKLRINSSEVMTDAGFARLFKDWKNKPLSFVDVRDCRFLDANKPRENPHQVGFCSEAFRALMLHSAKSLRRVNVHGCRHIDKEAFEDVFGPSKTYLEMKKLEVSFCEQVSDFILGSIFRSCPNIRELIVFGCMSVKDVRVPRNKILVGVPNAQGMIIEGTEDSHDTVDQS
ncbi:hypothetical protein PFICI_12071 [Pestalotiopsis fici W106-1]|uniref:DNA repair protein rhp7 n=1 Tax=Pestalotiopsis fici (strain W106-1 / CGMCC3.15140) TaxID=1229662 RepID=W3WS88_PESFW|nr:uncharacterized protein PFICI_12071 [Pestalotiopsis fici W106-1]ETS76684.1 hypothetical protein PFICI_12071 [Pestalotiopsis fici W106-1]